MSNDKATAQTVALDRTVSIGERHGTPLLRHAPRIALVEFLVVAVTALVASIIYHRMVYGGVPMLLQYVSASFLLAGFYSLICLVDDQYDLVGENWTRFGLSRAAGALALAFTFFLAASFLIKIVEGYSRGTFLTQIAAVFPILIVTRMVLAQGVTAAVKAGDLCAHRVYVVSLGCAERRNQIEQKIGMAPNRILSWVEFEGETKRDVDARESVDVCKWFASLRDECRKLKPDVVVLTFDSQHAKYVSGFIESFSELPAFIQFVPIEMLPVLQMSKVNNNGQLRVLEISSRFSSLFSRLLKRALDLTVSIAAAVLLSPLLLLTAIAIKLDSPGPILFRQMRQGFNNEAIEVFKFRTMFHCPEGAAFRQATPNDERVTRIGRILRATNIDELPQLLNVLIGNMSIVGPRPHVTEHNEMYLESIKLMSRRHIVKPGITGWAQVNGFRGETDTHEKMLSRVEYDLYYVDNWSFFFDIKILLMTVLYRKAYTNAY